MKPILTTLFFIMSQVPPIFTPQTSFSGLAVQPITSTGLPGGELDAEFARAGDSINRLISRLGELQRDDGKLKNELVAIENLAKSSLALLSAGGANIRGKWFPATAYKSGDFVSVLKPAFSVSGTVYPAANGEYFLTGYENGSPVFGLNGLLDFVVKLETFIDGPTAPYGERWKLKGPTAILQGIRTAGATSPLAANDFYELTGETYQGKPVYRSATYTIRYSGTRWECVTTATGSVQFQAAPGASATPFGLTWSAAIGSGLFTAGATPPNEQGIMPTRQVVLWYSADSNGLPWSAGTSWTRVQGAGTLAITRYTGSTGLANSSYIAFQDHTSSALFEADAAKWALVAAPETTNNLSVNNFTGDGTAVSFILSQSAASVDNTQVYFDGIYQSKLTYNLDSETITFLTAPANGVEIEVVCGVATEITVTALSDGSVGTSKIQEYAVTEQKLATGSVSARALSIGSVGPDALAENAVTGSRIANYTITEEKLAVASVTTPAIKDKAVVEAKLGDNSVSSRTLQSGAVDSTKLASGPITLRGSYTPTLAAHLVTKDYLERANAVVNSMLQDAAVTNAKIAPGTITPDRMANSGNQPLQMIQSVKIYPESFAGGAWQVISGLVLSITRTNTNGKVRIQACIGCSSNNGNAIAFKIDRTGSSGVGVGNPEGSRQVAGAMGGSRGTANQMESVNIDFIDNLTGVSAATIEYRVLCYVYTGSTAYINRSSDDPDNDRGVRTISTLTLTEISN